MAVLESKQSLTCYPVYAPRSAQFAELLKTLKRPDEAQTGTIAGAECETPSDLAVRGVFQPEQTVDIELFQCAPLGQRPDTRTRPVNSASAADACNECSPARSSRARSIAPSTPSRADAMARCSSRGGRGIVSVLRLSRWKQGFEPPWGHQRSQPVSAAVRSAGSRPGARCPACRAAATAVGSRWVTALLWSLGRVAPRRRRRPPAAVEREAPSSPDLLRGRRTNRAGCAAQSIRSTLRATSPRSRAAYASLICSSG